MADEVSVSTSARPADSTTPNGSVMPQEPQATDPLLGADSNGIAQSYGTADAEDEEETENPDRPKGIRFAVVFTCILMGDFFVGYDTSCVTTLTSVITDEFHAIDDVGWYGIAYILASVSTILTFGQLYTIYPMKAVFLISFSIFGIGSFISAAAPSSVFFIIGRAVSGLGSAGVFSGGSIIVANTTPLKTRPIYQAMSGGIECVALAFGPLVSGAIADAVSWRASFYVMVPAAAIIIASVWIFVGNLPQPEKANLPSEEKWQQLDLLGMLFFLPMMVCLILALQLGGSVYPWGNVRIIVLLVFAAVLSVAYFASQWRAGDKAMFPLHLLKERSVLLGSATMFAISATLFVFAFYLPIYFQAVRGASTLKSGLMYIPTAASFAVAVLLAGNLTSWVGYYTPMMALGTLFLCVGAGLITTLKVDTPPEQWIIYQVLLGTGCGLAWQQPFTAVQTVLAEKHVATSLVTLSFVQELGGIVTLAISQSVFLTQLMSKVGKAVPGFDPRKILDLGPLNLIDAVPAEYRPAVYEALNETIVNIFYVGLVCACLTICAVGIEWKSVKNEKEEDSNDA